MQFYLAAVGVFSNPEDELFILHAMNGRFVLPLLALLLIISAALAHAGKRLIWLSVLPLVLVLFQTVLFILTGTIFNVGPPSEGEAISIPLAATFMLAFHAVNGAVIFFTCTVLIRRSWKLAFGAQTVPVTNPDDAVPARSMDAPTGSVEEVRRVP
nr:DUF6220 domain-containing protein [Arthrobacter stackebrandtii]